jgi:HPt (histidine-containing phosphotransfer) domain-containing protein
VNGALDRATLDDLLDSTGGDPEFVIELIDAYLGDAPNHLTAMRRAADEDDATLMNRAAHTLKSSSASLGALTLSALSRDVEELARNGATADGAALLPQVEAEWSRVEAAFGEYRSEIGSE